MPVVRFESLPDLSRLWAFAATRELSGDDEAALLSGVDAFLGGWRAHGMPLTCARDWRYNRFLAVAVDQRDAHASGCSIDGLYRVLRALESQLGVGLLGGGFVCYRADAGRIVSATREEFAAAAERAEITRDTIVFDLTVATVGEWLTNFEKPARLSWHNQLLRAPQRA